MENKKNELNKESRVIKFLLESKNINGVENLNNLWRKLNLNEKSEFINLRVIERVFGVYNKWSIEKKKERENLFKEEIKKVNIDYIELVKRFKEVKEKVKRSNRLKVFKIEIEK